MEVTESAEFVHLSTPFFAMACARRFPMIAQFGVESGGRMKRHIEQTLLKPGLGITSLREGQSSFGQAAEMTRTDEEMRYVSQGTSTDWRIRFVDERTFAVRLSGGLAGQFFRMAFAPEAAPVTVWGRFEDKPFPPARGKSIFDVPDVTVKYELPLLIHFPDYGMLKVTCADARVRARQVMKADPGMVGLNLGCRNTGYHTGRKAYHHGTVEVVFEVAGELEEGELTFRVEEEHYPKLAGLDFSDAKWDGLKRCWQNAFTLNPETLSMGDNPVLHGIAHLAIHFKSDMSVFTPPLLDGLSVHDILRRQLEITFRDCVGESGEINARYATPEGRKQSRVLRRQHEQLHRPVQLRGRDGRLVAGEATSCEHGTGGAVSDED